MALAFDAGASGASGSGTLTIAHTCTGANLILFASIMLETGSDNVMAVQYNGVSMTLIDKQQNLDANNFAYLYYLINPATGTNNLVITTSTGVLRAASASYTGAAQSGQPDSHNKSSVVGNNTTATTTVADNSWLVAAGNSESGTISAGAGTTIRANNNNQIAIADSNGPESPPGSYSLTYNVSSSDCVMIIASIAPFTGVVVSTGNPSYSFFM